MITSESSPGAWPVEEPSKFHRGLRLIVQKGDEMGRAITISLDTFVISMMRLKVFGRFLQVVTRPDNQDKGEEKQALKNCTIIGRGNHAHSGNMMVESAKGMTIGEPDQVKTSPSYRIIQIVKYL